MIKFLNSILFVGLIILITGCTAVNKGLDSASEVTKEGGKTVGKILDVPAGIAEGGAEEMIESDEENPYNR